MIALVEARHDDQDPLESVPRVVTHDGGLGVTWELGLTRTQPSRTSLSAGTGSRGTDTSRMF